MTSISLTKPLTMLDTNVLVDALYEDLEEYPVAYPTLADILSRPLPSRLRRLTHPVTSLPNRFSTPRLPRLAWLCAHRASLNPDPQLLSCVKLSAAEATAVPGCTAHL